LYNIVFYYYAHKKEAEKMNVLKNLSIGKKLILLIAVFIVGYAGFAMMAFRVLNAVRIHGKLYNQIVMSKNLISDVLPPPEYIIESYLAVLQLKDETERSAVQGLISELNRLKNEYDIQHQAWINEPLLEAGEMRTAMLEGSYNPVKKFYSIVFNEFIPAVERGDHETANTLALKDLKTLYQDHRKSIDHVVKLAMVKYESTEKMASATLQTDTVMLIIIALAVVAFAIILGVSISISITSPINTTIQAVKIIGEGDFTKRLDIARKDELGAMAHYFNEMLEKVGSLVVTIKKQSALLFTIGDDLSDNMSQTSAAVNQITSNIQSMKGRVLNQSASVTETHATMDQISANIEKLSKNVSLQTESVSHSSSAIEEMLANIRSVTDTLIKNANNMNDLAKASDVGREGLQEVAAIIQGIARDSEGLLEINGVMQNIASQTNLLAMNAAIEAAHAGEAGKGFAVVSDEIRKLAENSSTQSKTISAVLSKIKQSIDKITIATDDVLNKFKVIDQRVQTVAEQEENIRSAMEEQNTGSKLILEAVSQLNDLTAQVRGGSVEMQDGSKEVIHESKNLEAATQEIVNGMNEVADGTDQIDTAVNHVREISVQNKDNIEILVREVAKFKVA
jgi:methyl-accepting chemotaxis protein